jgi:UPF0755 protein
MRWLLRSTLVVMVATVLAAAVLTVQVRTWLHTPLAVPATAEQIVIEISPGISFSEFAHSLAERDLLEHPRWLIALARWRGDAVRIKAGEYALTGTLTPPELLDRLVAGDVLLHSVTLIEGWTFREALAAIRTHARIVSTETAASPTVLREAIGVVPDTPPCAPEGCDWAGLEGQLFPDTYRFPAGTRDVDILRQARVRLNNELEAAWTARASGLPFDNRYQALILASIVEKETGLATERDEIAGVFTRRLHRRMRLQSDPTVIYGVGDDYAGDITRAHLRTDTAYNTYTRRGLPPSPIALAGRAAIEAAVRPADGTALYFVATGEGDGSHYFSDTLEEHNAAVRRYLERTAGRNGQ